MASDWILGNVQALGYYRMNYDLDNWNKLIGQLKANHKVRYFSFEKHIILLRESLKNTCQFLWYSWVALPHKFTSSMNKNTEKFRKSSYWIWKPTHPQIHPQDWAKKPQSTKIGPHEFKWFSIWIHKYYVTFQAMTC